MIWWICAVLYFGSFGFFVLVLDIMYFSLLLLQELRKTSYFITLYFKYKNLTLTAHKSFTL
jgi:hypothetical protein